MNWLKTSRAWSEFAHGRATFLEHLKGTLAMLSAWRQPQDVRRCGFLHSSYTTEAFHFRYFDIAAPESRQQLRGVIGDAAEHLVYQYCAYDIAGGWLEQIALSASQGEDFSIDAGGLDFRCRADEERIERVSAADLAKLLVVVVADVGDQYCQVNAWQDVYLKEQPALWPGDGQPPVSMFFFSHLLRAARPYLQQIPPVFNNCTEVLPMPAELEARDLYWKAVQGASDLAAAELEALYRRASELNPYIAEPHVMLSQLLFNRGAFAEAVHEAACALDLFYQWSTAWDKRNSFGQWVGFTRMALLRAKRRQQGLEALPFKPLSPRPAKRAWGQRAVFLQDLVAAFDDCTEGGPPGGPRARL